MDTQNAASPTMSNPQPQNAGWLPAGRGRGRGLRMLMQNPELLNNPQVRARLESHLENLRMSISIPSSDALHKAKVNYLSSRIILNPIPQSKQHSTMIQIYRPLTTWLFSPLRHLCPPSLQSRLLGFESFRSQGPFPIYCASPSRQNGSLLERHQIKSCWMTFFSTSSTLLTSTVPLLKATRLRR